MHLISNPIAMASAQRTFMVPPPPPPPSSDGDTTVIVIVFVSLGGVVFLAFLLLGVLCLIKRSGKRERMGDEIDVVKADERLTVKEAAVAGPHGRQAVVLTMEDDVHIQELIRKEGGRPGKPAGAGIGTSSSGSDHRHYSLHHKS